MWAAPAFEGIDPREQRNYILIDKKRPVPGITR
jgi:hypothetical protein